MPGSSSAASLLKQESYGRVVQELGPAVQRIRDRASLALLLGTAFLKLGRLKTAAGWLARAGEDPALLAYIAQDPVFAAAIQDLRLRRMLEGDSSAAYA